MPRRLTIDTHHDMTRRAFSLRVVVHLVVANDSSTARTIRAKESRLRVDEFAIVLDEVKSTGECQWWTKSATGQGKGRNEPKLRDSLLRDHV